MIYKILFLPGGPIQNLFLNIPYYNFRHSTEIDDGIFLVSFIMSIIPVKLHTLGFFQKNLLPLIFKKSLLKQKLENILSNAVLLESLSFIRCIIHFNITPLVLKILQINKILGLEFVMQHPKSNFVSIGPRHKFHTEQVRT